MHELRHQLAESLDILALGAVSLSEQMIYHLPRVSTISLHSIRQRPAGMTEDYKLDLRLPVRLE